MNQQDITYFKEASLMYSYAFHLITGVVKYVVDCSNHSDIGIRRYICTEIEKQKKSSAQVIEFRYRTNKLDTSYLFSTNL